MAVRCLGREVSDLCLGKPPLRSLPLASSTISDALSAIKTSGDIHISVWCCSCDSTSSSHNRTTASGGGNCCRCVGKICMVDVILYLCRDDNVSRPFDALLQSPVADLIPKGHQLITHLEPHASLLEAIDHLLEGAQNLVIPIQGYKRNSSWRKLLNKPSSFANTFHNGQEFCWLKQEDIARFLLDSIGAFSPLPTFTIEQLNIISMDSMTVHYNDPASVILVPISQLRLEQTCIAVVDEEKRLVGEISPHSLATSNETVAAAIMTLSAGDLMAYIDCCGPPDDLVDLVKRRLQEKNLPALLDLMESSLSSSSSSSSCSSDEEYGSSRRSNSGHIPVGRRSETIVCHPWNSLMAVMIQMIAHRVNYAWVVEEDYSLIGMVTFTEILKVFHSMAGLQSKTEQPAPNKQ